MNLTKRNFQFVSLAALIAVTAFSVQADLTYYVRQNGGSDSNDGKSYAQAFATFEKGRSAANKNGAERKNVYVYPGYYRPSAGGTKNPFEMTFGNGNVHIFGVKDDGAGEVFTPAARDEVVIDCENNQRVFQAQGGTSNNHANFELRNLTCLNGLAQSSVAGKGGFLEFGGGTNDVIVGCVFSNAVATISGGAIYANLADMVIEDCDFYECSAADAGGAIYVTKQTGSLGPDIRNCRFYDCETTSGTADSSCGGGAIACPTGDTQGNGVRLWDCTFSNCTTVANGGALWGCHPLVSNCTFTACQAAGGGAVDYLFSLTIKDRTNCFYSCTFAHCLSKCDLLASESAGYVKGGVLDSYGQANQNEQSWCFRDCTFANNVSYGYSPLVTKARYLDFRNCVVSNNATVWNDRLETYKTDKNFLDYSKFLCTSESAVVSNCSFVANLTYGSKIVSLGDNSFVADCKFLANTNATFDGRTKETWGGTLSFGAGSTLRNSLFAHNRCLSDKCSGCVLVTTQNTEGYVIDNVTVYSNAASKSSLYGAGFAIHTSNDPTLHVRNCISTGNFYLSGSVSRDANVDKAGAMGGGCENCSFGNATRFKNVESGDFHLRTGATERNSGLLLDWMTNATDLDGAPRLNTDGTVAMGCYRYNMEGFMLIIK